VVNENDVRDAMKQALRADADGEPDMEMIVQGGRRQRRAAVRKAALGGAVLAVAGFGMSYAVTHTQTRPQSQSVAPDLAGQARTPSLPPHNNSRSALGKAHAAVRAALADGLPAGMALKDGSGLSDFYLVHSDGTTTSLGAEVGLQSLAGLKNPCTTSTYNTNCRPVSLSDGSRGWAWETDAGQKEGHAVSVVVYTQDGHAWGLSDDDGETDPASSKNLEKGEPLTEAQLISLVSRPQVMAALKQVPTDQVTSAQTGQPYHP
jgi:hypothetical protein